MLKRLWISRALQQDGMPSTPVCAIIAPQAQNSLVLNNDKSPVLMRLCRRLKPDVDHMRTVRACACVCVTVCVYMNVEECDGEKQHQEKVPGLPRTL